MKQEHVQQLLDSLEEFSDQDAAMMLVAIGLMTHLKTVNDLGMMETVTNYLNGSFSDLVEAQTEANTPSSTAIN